GFTSRCTLITCDWVGGEWDENLPKRAILKISSVLPMRRVIEALPKEERMFDSEEAWAALEAQFCEGHNTEIDTYKFFAEFEHLAVPKMFFGYPFDANSTIYGQICMEFVENSAMMSFTEAAPLKLLKQIARALGKVQACSVNKNATSPQFTKDMLGDFAKTMNSEAYTNAFNLLKSYDSSPRMCEAIENVEKLLPDYYGSNLMSTIHKQMKYRPVLVSGETDHFIVFQFTHHGVGVEDLLRIQMYSQLTKDR
ncbi:hypothetical protein PMAYCL1PPCAC_32064, partial [Pristionchus mayeri]